MGESYGAYTIGNDEAILDFVTSVNIACGFHAGDPVVMGKTVRMAIDKGKAIGAHPGLPDLMGFGRRNMNLTTEEAKAYLTYQIGALYGFVKAYGGKLQHVKPHGALYNMAATDNQLAKALAEAVQAIDKKLIFVGLANSAMIEEAQRVGLKTAQEVFADRNYMQNGLLVPRSSEDALIHDENFCIERVLKMVKDKKVAAIDGTEVKIAADTVCIHGDHPKALSFAQRLKQALLAENVLLTPMNDTITINYL